jgi:hypothetical protein
LAIICPLLLELPAESIFEDGQQINGLEAVSAD